MFEDDSDTPLLTAATVKQWRREYDEVGAEIARLTADRGNLRRKLEGVASILSPDVALALIGELEPAETPVREQKFLGPTKPRSQMTLGEATLDIIKNARGGRSSKWIREAMARDPDFGFRVTKSPTGVSTALSRHAERGVLVRSKEGLYYLPEVYEAIKRGDIKEERSSGWEGQSLTAMLHQAMSGLNRPFTAGDAVQVVRSDPVLSAKVGENDNRIYSWLGREIFKKKLNKEGDTYFYPERSFDL